MIRLESDATHANSIVNHPDVFPWVSLPGQSSIDIAPLIDGRNVLLSTEFGFFVGINHGSGLYEVHTQFLRKGRGRHAIMAAKEAIRWMFSKTDCTELVTKVPVDNKAAEKLTRMIGFEKRFSRKQVWPRNDTKVDVNYYSLPISSWVSSDDYYISRGEWFHKKIGDIHVNHDKDEAHDRFVGASLDMAMNGQVVKGVNFYNRWAVFSGYELAHMIEPDLVDIHECKLRIKGNDLEVISCQ